MQKDVHSGMNYIHMQANEFSQKKLDCAPGHF